MEDNKDNETTTATATNLNGDENLIKGHKGEPKKAFEAVKDTYFVLGNEGVGKMEIDLVTYREKGEETRYIAMMFSGMNIKEEPPTPQEAFFNIETKEEFSDFKKFIANLNWDD